MLNETEKEAEEIAEAAKKVKGIVGAKLERQAEEVEKRYQALTKHKAELQDDLSVELTENTIGNLLQFREAVALGLENPTFEDRRRWLQILQMRVTVTNGIAVVTCRLEVQPLEYNLFELQTLWSCYEASKGDFMKVLIAGGSGFLGTALKNALIHNSHEVFILTRGNSRGRNQIHWDGKTTDGWGYIVNEMDAVVNLTGYGLEHWPWTKRQKQKFVDSRVLPGRALVSAIQSAPRRPKVFLQSSGVNYYGLRGEGIADEPTPAAEDFLAQMTAKGEAATQPVEELDVRRVVVRNAVVLAGRGGLFPLMALPVKLFFGGKLGDGSQSMPWIHLVDEIRAMKYLLENEESRGAYNLIAPTPTSNTEFMRAIAKTLHRPFWFHVPKFLLRLALGEMSVLITEGRYSQPKRLLENGFEFTFPRIEDALRNIFSK